MKKHVKKNDLVVVLSGNERGKRGKILTINVQAQRVAVEGVKIIKKAIKKTQDRPQGGFQEKEGFIHISNVMLAEKYDKRHGNALKTK